MQTVLLGVELAMLALQVAILLRIADIPHRTAERLRRELSARARADAEAWEPATAKRVGELVAGLSTAAEQMHASAVELRTIQGDGAELLIEQRAYTGELSVLARTAAKQRVSIAPRAPELEDEQRKTVEMGRPPTSCAPAAAPAADDDEPEEEELTQVAARPVAGTPSASNGLRLPSRALIPPPPASPRGSEQP
jgi:hypothetical protein